MMKSSKGKMPVVAPTHGQKTLYAAGSLRQTGGGLTPLRGTVADHILRMLQLLDGQERTAYSIWRIPAGETDPMAVGETFIQAGGSAQAMTVEARVMTSDGTARLFTVGRQEPVKGPPTTIWINDRAQVTVSSNEVFTAEEAAVVFLTFYLTDTVAQPYQLRELNFGDG
ncbi:hypothetical protein [Microbacterium sp. GXS0129]|uniref:hypothetical protein n=1 Tax=Microbacterium sp. GXS0129 TaxID=3377836 RepID=UPI00383B19F6